MYIPDIAIDVRGAWHCCGWVAGCWMLPRLELSCMCLSYCILFKFPTVRFLRFARTYVRVPSYRCHRFAIRNRNQLQSRDLENWNLEPHWASGNVDECIHTVDKQMFLPPNGVVYGVSTTTVGEYLYWLLFCKSKSIGATSKQFIKTNNSGT